MSAAHINISKQIFANNTLLGFLAALKPVRMMK